MQDEDKNLTEDTETPVNDDMENRSEDVSKETSDEKVEESADDSTSESGQEEQPMASSGAATPAGTDDRGRQMYNVKCSNCGNDTTVPFMPAEGRPVYCRDCFMKMKDGDR